MQSINNSESNEVNTDKSDTKIPQGTFTFGSKIPVTESNNPTIGGMAFGMGGGLQFAASSNASINPRISPATTVAGAFGSSTNSVNQRTGPPTTVSGVFGFGSSMNSQQNTMTGGCCRTIPPNIQRHPETGLPIPPQQNVFGIRTELSNTSRDKLIDELYSELRTLREHVNESNKLIGNIYELLRKI